MNIEHLYKSFGNQDIFVDASCSINKYDKVGIIGDNGAGKSTLFKMILNEEDIDSGNINLSFNYGIGYLAQVISDDIYNSDISVFDYLLEGRPVKKLQKKLNNLYEKMATSSSKDLKKIYDEVDEISKTLDYYDQYSYEEILFKMIDEANIPSSLLDLKLNSLSGGQKSKIAFLRLLFSKPDILLLDEPTNHLDIDTKDYIIDFIKNYKGMVLVISHDIEFLNAVCNKTLYVDKLKHNMVLYNGNYDKYLKIKNEREKAALRLHEKQAREEEKLKNIIAKYIGGNEKKANIAKDRIKKLERLQEEKVVLEKKNKYAKFSITMDYPSYSVPIRVNNLTFGYDEENLLYDNLTFDISRKERFLIVGENGIGKTTLLKLIMNILKPLEGNIEITEKTTLSYYAQEHEILDKDKTIFENFENSGMLDYEVRRFLGSFLFSKDEIYKKVSVLSPGERSRVALAKVALLKANTILLDEPTNHLDPMTQIIIADIFKTFEGTILLVSHNLEFVESLNIDRILLLPSGRVIEYDRDIVLMYEELNEKQ